MVEGHHSGPAALIKQLDMNHPCRAITGHCFEPHLFQLRGNLQIQSAIFMIMSSVSAVFQRNTINGGAGVSPTTEVCGAAAHLIYCVLLNNLNEALRDNILLKVL